MAVREAVLGPAERFSIEPDDATRDKLVRWHARYGRVYSVAEPRRGALDWVVHDAERVREVLVRRSRQFTKGRGLERVKILLGNGLMVSEGDFWVRQRRLLQPAFRPRALADFNAMIVDENQAMAESWRAAAESGQPVEAAAAVSELTLVIVLKAIFGADYDALAAEHGNPFALLTKHPERDLRFAARFNALKRIVARLIETRRAASRPAFDLFGHLLTARDKAGEPMTIDAVVDEVMTLIVAGHETTASALAWAWYLLATHADICARAQAEVDRVDERALARTGGESGELALIDAVLAETLRLYPPGWLLSRRALADVALGEHRLKAGTQVFISPYVLQRDAGYWPQPEWFDPARFAGEARPAPRFAYVPFAAGGRRCVGESLAWTEMRVHLAMMLRRFTPAYAGRAPPGLEAHVNLRPADGVRLQLAARTKTD